MVIEPVGIDFQFRFVGQGVFIRGQVGFPQRRLALWRLDRLEPFDKRCPFDLAGQRGSRPQQLDIQQHADKTEHRLHFLVMAPFFDAVVELHDHLRGGHREHRLAESGDQEQ